MAEKIVNAMSVDVEDYFQVSAFAQHVDRQDWAHLPSRVERNTDKVMELFDQAGVKATFFTLGWVAERHPALIRRIVESGHELASHGFAHFRATDQTPEEFRADVRRTKRLLEDTGGVAVSGYRAASFSIGANNLWALEVLAQEGYRYSSSIYPVRHDHYGMPEAPRFAHHPMGARGVLELPISTLRLGGRNLPVGGGGYFRLVPYAAFRWALRRLNSDDRMPAVFYFHPWEVDPEQPRPEGLSAKTRFRHYINLGRMERRLGTMLADFAWDRLDRIFLAEDQVSAS
jgi:polysaccharide deacetylase family protein (PEP-CTERM system associated)